MGSNYSTIKSVNFEDVKNVEKNNYLLISTLPDSSQDCLIYCTIPVDKEVKLVEESIKNKSIIIIYGFNYTDSSIYKKYNQIKALGHNNVYIYQGGLFEWLVLQDIYGDSEFKTSSYILDHLKYKPVSDLNIFLIKN